MSGSTGLLLTILVPVAVLITIIIATLLLISYTLRRKGQISLSSAKERIEEYASVQISPVDSKVLMVPPPVPRTPRPNDVCCNRQENVPQEAAYALLQDPTQRSNSNRCTLDLTFSPSSTTHDGHTNGQEPVYNEL